MTQLASLSKKELNRTGRDWCKCSGAQHTGACNRRFYKERERQAHELRIKQLELEGKYKRSVTSEIGKTVWVPREHQKLLREARDRGIRWQAHVWHRRAGKTAACLDLLVSEAQRRIGNYWFMCPKLNQSRVAIWESRRADGIREIDVHIPHELRARTNENLMLIELLNGSTIRFLGSDGFDRLVGANVHGIVFDEFALADPAAWDYLRPILMADPEQQSWAVFISTYRGRNHWYRLVERVKQLPDEWVTSILSINDTKREDGKPIVTEEDIQRLRDEGRPEEYLRQEYYNDPMAAFEGAFYALPMRRMQNEGRIGPVMHDPSLPVVCSVDLGYADEMVFTFWQSYGNEHRCIGSKSWKFTNLADVLDDVKLTFPWGKRPMTAVIPHDGRFGASELFEKHGYSPILLPRTSSVAQEIEKVRSFLGRVRIDNAVRPWTDNEENNARLVEALLGYRTERSKTDADTYQKQPAHTWESHWCDSVRYYAVALDTGYLDTDGWSGPIDYSRQDRAQAGLFLRR